VTHNQIGLIFEFVALLMVIWRDEIRAQMTSTSPAIESLFLERRLLQSQSFRVTPYIARLVADNYHWLISFFLIVGIVFQFIG
jgi:hypothetical protein